MRLFVIILLCHLSLMLAGQKVNLANEYFRNGEYEKAAALYKQLHDKSSNTNYYFNAYIKALKEGGKEKEAITELKSEIKRRPDDVDLLVSYGHILEQSNDLEGANKQFRTAIDKLKPDVSQISKLANAFISSIKYDLAEETYLKGIKLLKNDKLFAMNLGDLYRRKDDKEKMIQYYLSAIRDQPKNLNRVQSILHRGLKSKEGYEELKKQLYENIQNHPEAVQFPEMLQWTFIQEKAYGRAFRQARLLDRQLEEDGLRVYRLAAMAEQDKDYPSAIKAYNYIIEDKGKVSSYYVKSNLAVLRCKRKLITSDYVYTPAEMDSLDMEYDRVMSSFGINSNTATLAQEYAGFLVQYRGNTKKAIDLLEETKDIASLSSRIKANVKLDLADYYLIDDNIWEATLIYSQVDKEFKEEYEGELARFKNAKFSYYTGDFEWAQAQFDILKAATSRLISNDAIDLSVFIMDNLNSDSTAVPLQMYANAELLGFQNKYDEAFMSLDSILYVYPEHGLKDDVLYTKANIYKKKQEYTEAEAAYMEIIEDFPEDIRCDNAMFELAELYEYQLDDKEKAKALYEKLFVDYSNSTYAIEARKRFRRLRGDDV